MTIILVHHRHGEDVLEGKDEEEAVHELAEYCREWWDEISNRKPPKDQHRLITRYFDKKEDEWWEFR